MDLKVAHDFIRDQLGQERGGYETPTQIDSYLHRAQLWLFKQFLPDYSKDQAVEDALSVFKTPFTFTSSGAGAVTLPIDPTVTPCYEYLCVMWAQYFDNTLSKVRYKPIKFISEDELPDRLNSQILEPTITDPVGIEKTPGTFQLYPEVAISGKGFYLKTPVAPIFVFTQAGRVITYNQAGSTQLAWNESSMNKILVRALQYAGVNLSDGGMIEFTEKKAAQDI